MAADPLSGMIILLLPLAAASGWFLARRSPPEDQEPSPINPDYVRGISHLVNDDTDKAVEVFMGLLQADNETVELHLALGSLFRRRGEIDRALRIHQNLVLRPSLKPAHRNQARFELARDYLKAGVYDRAEDLFRELANQGMFLEPSLRHLASIFERERDWEKAIEMARWLGSARGQNPGAMIAHYYCEIAEQQRRSGDDKAVQQALKKALAADSGCVRASMIEAEILQERGDSAGAVAAYSRVAKQDPAFIPEILRPLGDLYAAQEDLASWQRQLTSFSAVHEGAAPQIVLAQLRLAQNEDPLVPLLQYLATRPSWLGFNQALALPWAAASPELQEAIGAMREALHEVIGKSPGYQCRHCGYAAHVLNWQCPSCQHWDTTQPLSDLSHKAIMVGHVTSTIAQD